MLLQEDASNNDKEQKGKIKVATRKDFSNILDAYNFFKEHSTEYEANRCEVVLMLEQSNLLKKGISILDFGSGDGEFLSDLYTKIDFNKFDPRLYIYEPVEYNQESAKLKLSSVGYDSLTVLENVDDFPEATLDLILVNHVLYYVENLGHTISTLISKLDKNGQLWILMASDDNSLIKLWGAFFEKLGMKIPYFLTADLKFILENKFIEYSQTKKIKSAFRFINSPENRNHMARFLLGNYSNQFDDETIKETISSYEKNDEIDLPLCDILFMIRKNEIL